LAKIKKSEGNEFYKAGKYSKAAELYSEAIKLHPEEPAYRGNRCAAFLMIRRFKDALEDSNVTHLHKHTPAREANQLSTKTNLSPCLPRSFFILCVLQAAIQLDPHSEKHYTRAAKCHTAMGNLRAAAEVCVVPSYPPHQGFSAAPINLFLRHGLRCLFAPFLHLKVWESLRSVEMIIGDRDKVNIDGELQFLDRLNKVRTRAEELIKQEDFKAAMGSMPLLVQHMGSVPAAIRWPVAVGRLLLVLSCVFFQVDKFFLFLMQGRRQGRYNAGPMSLGSGRDFPRSKGSFDPLSLPYLLQPPTSRLDLVAGCHVSR